MKFNVLTYNIHKGFSVNNQRFVLHQIREQLRKIDVDVVFLQEAQGSHKTREITIADWPQESQFEFLADELWQHYAYGKNAIYDAGHHGNAILSKYPFVFQENLNVSSLRRASRSILHGIIQIPDLIEKLHIVCVHFDFIAYERVRQIKLLNNRIRDHIPINEPLILAGDFNDWGGGLDRHLATDLGLTEAFKQSHGRHAKTYPAWWPVLPVDRIYYRGMNLIECHCLNGVPWRKLSDHSPLIASFEL